MQSHVHLQAAGLSEALFTLWTFNRLLTGVYQQVFSQVGRCYGCIFTFTTFVRPLTTVNTNVNFKLTLLCTCVLAILTTVRLHFAVR